MIKIFLLYGAIAQLGERLRGTQKVRGSIPLGSTIHKTLPDVIKNKGHSVNINLKGHSILN
tara:strand:+ start:881 stop:1063 length:183 start_codon:yes stop_codon:yes gene_type:complete